MKKNRIYGLMKKIGLFKMIKIMRFTIFILFLSLSQTFAVNSYSQQAKLSLDMRNARLEDVIDKIEKNSEFFFMYNKGMIDVNRMVDIHVEEKSVNEVLDKIFANTGIYYSIKDRQILLVNNHIADENNESFTQQQKSIFGKVTDSTGASLPGVSVVVKGTTNGTITDVNGNYSLSNIPVNATLQFSFVGMKTQEILLGNKTIVNVTLIEETVGLEEVVAVGYGTQSKRNVTGAISKVNMKITENLPNTNVTQSLRGRVAGVQFTDNARPGQNGSILIRGPRSLNAGNNPLIVVDGIPFNGSLSDINPNDIESMDILKDASAAAIYGSRAANGVILITSKKGSTEKPTIRINTFSGISDWSYKVKLLSPERYLQKTVDVLNQNGRSAVMDNIRNYLTTSELVNYDAGKTVDPYDAISQQGSINSFDLSMSAKTDLTNYFLSASYTKEKGLIYNDNLNRLALRCNIENKVTKWLSVGLSSTFIKRDAPGQVASLGSAYSATPYGTWYYPDGLPTKYVIEEDQIPYNAMRDALQNTNEETYNNLFANFYGLIEFPFLKGLKYRFNYSPNYRWQHNFNSVIQDIHFPTINNTSASKFYRQDFDWVVENILTYSRQITSNQFIDLTFLYGSNHSEFESTTANSTRLSSDILSWNNLGLGEVLTNSSTAQASNGVSSMLRINYRLRDKYFLTLTARRDGSSVFASNNKYATFPSVAFAWLASDEEFLKNISFLDRLKFRLSYGAVGNQAISPYQSLSLSSTQRYVFGDGGTSSLGVYPSNMSNSNLKWETTYTSNIAVDFELLKGRLGGTFEAYNMDTRNLIVKRSLPDMTGYAYVLTNLGETNNKGIEVTLNTVNLKKGKFEWNSNFVFSNNKNKIIHLYNSDTNNDGKEDDDLGNLWFIGQPVNVAYDYVFDGIYQENEDMPAGYKPGYVRLKDLNGDKIIDSKDRKIIGQTGQPKFRWGITNTVIYGNFSFSVFINAMQGWISHIVPADYSVSGGNYPHRPLNQLDAGWWTAENKSNKRPSLVYPNPYGIKYYYSRNFIRIQDVSFTYNFPKKIINRINLTNLGLTFSGKNLFTFTKWIGPDPENGYNTNGSFYPTARSFNVGINFGF